MPHPTDAMPDPTPKCPRCQLPLVQGLQRTCDCPPSWATTPHQRGLWTAIGWHRDALHALAAVDRIQCRSLGSLERELRAYIRHLEDALFSGDPVPEHTCPGPMTRPCACGLSEAQAKRLAASCISCGRAVDPASTLACRQCRAEQHRQAMRQEAKP